MIESRDTETGAICRGVAVIESTVAHLRLAFDGLTVILLQLRSSFFRMLVSLEIAIGSNDCRKPTGKIKYHGYMIEFAICLFHP